MNILRLHRSRPVGDPLALSAQCPSRWERAVASTDVSLLPEYVRIKRQACTANWKL